MLVVSRAPEANPKAAGANVAPAPVAVAIAPPTKTEPVVVEIKPKQKRNYTKKTKSGELDNTQNTVEEKPIEISEEIVKSPSDIETQSIEEKETDIIVKEATETTETPVQ